MLAIVILKPLQKKKYAIRLDSDFLTQSLKQLLTHASKMKA